uniref:Uncharacterized protein n=1 Tax=Cucumis melo TaxID=3656 RepID=A0A9I9EDL6_CUCME
MVSKLHSRILFTCGLFSMAFSGVLNGERKDLRFKFVLRNGVRTLVKRESASRTDDTTTFASAATVNGRPCLCSRSSFHRAAATSSQQSSPELSPHLCKQPVTSIVPSTAVSLSAPRRKSSIVGLPSQSSLGVVSKRSPPVDASPSCTTRVVRTSTRAALIFPESHAAELSPTRVAFCLLAEPPSQFFVRDSTTRPTSDIKRSHYIDEDNCVVFMFTILVKYAIIVMIHYVYDDVMTCFMLWIWCVLALAIRVVPAWVSLGITTFLGLRSSMRPPVRH